MTDIAHRLRHWSHGLTYDPAVGLMHEAAAEIERLRWKVAVNRNIAQRLLAAVEKLRGKQPIDERIKELL